MQKIKDNEFSIYQKVTSLDCTYKNCTIEFILDTSNLDEMMNLEFEVQTTEKREETKEIEELNYYTVISAVPGKFEENVDEELQKITNKINKLVRAVNKPIKESEEK